MGISTTKQVKYEWLKTSYNKQILSLIVESGELSEGFKTNFREFIAQLRYCGRSRVQSGSSALYVATPTAGKIINSRRPSISAGTTIQYAQDMFDNVGQFFWKKQNPFDTDAEHWANMNMGFSNYMRSPIDFDIFDIDDTTVPTITLSDVAVGWQFCIFLAIYHLSILTGDTKTTFETMVTNKVRGLISSEPANLTNLLNPNQKLGKNNSDPNSRWLLAETSFPGSSTQVLEATFISTRRIAMDLATRIFVDYLFPHLKSANDALNIFERPYIDLIATGDGTVTKGIFNIQLFGILFFQYSLKNGHIQENRKVDIRSHRLKSLKSIMVGNDLSQNSTIALIPDTNVESDALSMRGNVASLGFLSGAGSAAISFNPLTASSSTNADDIYLSSIDISSAKNGSSVDEVFTVLIGRKDRHGVGGIDFGVEDFFENDEFILQTDKVKALLNSRKSSFVALAGLMDRATVPVCLYDVQGCYIGKLVEQLKEWPDGAPMPNAIDDSNAFPRLAKIVSGDAEHSSYLTERVPAIDPITEPELYELYKNLRYSVLETNIAASQLTLTINAFVSPLRSRLDKKIDETNFETCSGKALNSYTPTDFEFPSDKIRLLNFPLSGVRAWGFLHAVGDALKLLNTDPEFQKNVSENFSLFTHDTAIDTYTINTEFAGKNCEISGYYSNNDGDPSLTAYQTSLSAEDFLCFVKNRETV